MDTRACQLFIAIAEHGHLAHAARSMHQSPSAVSRQLQRLEQQVGHTLIERDNRQLRLTPAGRRFLRYAEQAMLDWRQLKRDLDGQQQQCLNGEISVYGSVTASYSVLGQILPALRSAQPGIELKLRTGDQADGTEHVLAGTEDCAIIARPEQLSPKLVFLPLQHSPLMLIGPTTACALSRELDTYLRSRAAPPWAQLPFILAERGLARERLLQRLAELGVPRPNLYAQVSGHEAVAAMVALGFGLALIPEIVLEHSPRREALRALPWFEAIEPFSIGLCALKARLNDPLLRALWHCASQSESAAVRPR